MASNMTTKEKLMHPVTAVKEMMGKGPGHTGTDTTHTQATSAKNEAGVIGRYEQPMAGVTSTTPTTMGNEEQLNNQMGGTPTLGTTAGSGARPVFSETGNEVGINRAGHHGHHTGAGVAGAGATGLAGYEAERHLGQHGQHTGHHLGQNTAGVGATGLAGYEAERHLGQHGQHTGTHHTGTGLAGAGVGGVGAYEAERHLGHHNRHNDAATLAGTPGLPGTTGTAGEVFTPNDPRPHNVGLNVIGMNTPLNTSDVRSYDNPTAQSAPRNTTPSHIDEGRLNATSLPANPLMSAVTGGKIPPSIHKGFEQAGVYDGANRTGVHDTTTGAHDTTRVGHTGARRNVV